MHKFCNQMYKKKLVCFYLFIKGVLRLRTYGEDSLQLGHLRVSVSKPNLSKSPLTSAYHTRSSALPTHFQTPGQSGIKPNTQI